MKKWKILLSVVIPILVVCLGTVNVWAKKYVVKDKYSSKYSPMEIPYDPLYWGETMKVNARVGYTYDMTSSDEKVMKVKFATKYSMVWPYAKVTAVGGGKGDVTEASILCWGYSLKKEWENYWGQKITIQKPYFICDDSPLDNGTDGIKVLYLIPTQNVDIELISNNLGEVSWSTEDTDHCRIEKNYNYGKVRIRAGYSGSTMITAKYKGYKYKLKVVITGDHYKIKNGIVKKVLDLFMPYSSN